MDNDTLSFIAGMSGTNTHTNKQGATLTATIIPFPVNPRASRADVYYDTPAQPIALDRGPLRFDGVPLRAGDRVRASNPRTGQKREGIILQEGMTGCYTAQKTYSILLLDGTRLLASAEYIECALTAEKREGVQ